jgi:hypothetical protein
VVHLPPSLPFQDEDKHGLGCWCSAWTRTLIVPPRLNRWWWILARTLAVYLEGQHDWLGTLGRPHRFAFATFEPPVMGGILNFFLTGSQRKKTMNGNETAPFLGCGGSFSFGPRSWLVVIKPLVQIVIRPLDFSAYSLWSLEFNLLQFWLKMTLNFDISSIKPLIALINSKSKFNYTPKLINSFHFYQNWLPNLIPFWLVLKIFNLCWLEPNFKLFFIYFYCFSEFMLLKIELWQICLQIYHPHRSEGLKNWWLGL